MVNENGESSEKGLNGEEAPTMMIEGEDRTLQGKVSNCFREEEGNNCNSHLDDGAHVWEEGKRAVKEVNKCGYVEVSQEAESSQYDLNNIVGLKNTFLMAAQKDNNNGSPRGVVPKQFNNQFPVQGEAELKGPINTQREVDARRSQVSLEKKITEGVQLQEGVATSHKSIDRRNAIGR
ncbi:hypothetical protein L6452_00543 [Arctium lappa]|uniref:Uncharacterized protein n=1 Tax=Arctium lappa TaxID=4217 RepID=A0ACB9FF14_ARCLA|nr:hypothetical protein L6452_00543 [Arctium lappa]